MYPYREPRLVSYPIRIQSNATSAARVVHFCPHPCHPGNPWSLFPPSSSSLEPESTTDVPDVADVLPLRSCQPSAKATPTSSAWTSCKSPEKNSAAAAEQRFVNPAHMLRKGLKGPPLVPPCHDVANRPGILNANQSCHRPVKPPFRFPGLTPLLESYKSNERHTTPTYLFC